VTDRKKRVTKKVEEAKDWKGLVEELRNYEEELESQNDELRRVHADLEDSRNRYFELFDLAPVGYITLDALGQITEVNLAASEMLVSSRRRLVGQRFAEFLTDEGRAQFEAHRQRVLATRRRGRCELRLVRADGRTFEALLDSVIVDLGERDSPSLWLIVSDISASKRTQLELLELNATLEERVILGTAEAERKAAQMQALALQVTDAERRERRRVAQLLHDHLQQLLVACSLTLQSLRSRAIDKEMSDSLTSVISMVREAIKASRTVAADLSPAVLYDRGLAAALEWQARSKREKYGLEVEVSADSSANPQNESLSAFLFQAVHELLFNIFKHAGTKRARVTMARPEPDRIEIRVEDEGRGCDPQTVDLEGLQVNGEGFGLFSIKKRLELLGGSFTIESAPGRGCCVRLVVPNLDQVREESREPAEARPRKIAPPPVLEAGSPKHAIRVLLVDDHKIVREGLAGLLLDEPDIELVGEAADGEAAVELARSLLPDVVVMDVTLPYLSGIEATRMITKEMPGIRVIGLSMHEEQDMASAMREVGAVGYVSKSVAAERLLSAIRAAYLPSSPGAPSAS
jgi:PAS domain S-box-containing protein